MGITKVFAMQPTPEVESLRRQSRIRDLGWAGNVWTMSHCDIGYSSTLDANGASVAWPIACSLMPFKPGYTPWNKGRSIGQKRPFKLPEVETIRAALEKR